MIVQLIEIDLKSQEMFVSKYHFNSNIVFCCRVVLANTLYFWIAAKISPYDFNAFFHENEHNYVKNDSSLL